MAATRVGRRVAVPKAAAWDLARAVINLWSPHRSGAVPAAKRDRTGRTRGETTTSAAPQSPREPCSPNPLLVSQQPALQVESVLQSHVPRLKSQIPRPEQARFSFEPTRDLSTDTEAAPVERSRALTLAWMRGRSAPKSCKNSIVVVVDWSLSHHSVDGADRET